MGLAQATAETPEHAAKLQGAVFRELGSVVTVEPEWSLEGVFPSRAVFKVAARHEPRREWVDLMGLIALIAAPDVPNLIEQFAYRDLGGIALESVVDLNENHGQSGSSPILFPASMQRMTKRYARSHPIFEYPQVKSS